MSIVAQTDNVGRSVGKSEQRLDLVYAIVPVLCLICAFIGGKPFWPALCIAGCSLVGFGLLYPISIDRQIAGKILTVVVAISAAAFYVAYVHSDRYPAMVLAMFPAFDAGRRRASCILPILLLAMLGYRVYVMSDGFPLHADRLLFMLLLLSLAFAAGKVVRLLAGMPVTTRVIEITSSEVTHQEPTPELTERELEVLRLLAEGRSYREVGELLYISSGTARAHGAALLRKSGTHDRASLIGWALEKGYISNREISTCKPPLPTASEKTGT
jgi:DNA-binding CsgD family transcriptional regulator